MHQVRDVTYRNSWAVSAGWGVGFDLIVRGAVSEEQAARSWLKSAALRPYLMDAHGSMGAFGLAQSGQYWTLYLADNADP